MEAGADGGGELGTAVVVLFFEVHGLAYLEFFEGTQERPAARARTLRPSSPGQGIGIVQKCWQGFSSIETK